MVKSSLRAGRVLGLIAQRALALYAAAWVCPLFASGTLPPISIDTELQSFSACLQKLKNQESADAAQATNAPLELAPGQSKWVEVQSKGVQSTAIDAAQYASEIWFHHGAWDESLKQMRVSHSYERIALSCSAERLRSTRNQGYTLESFEQSPKVTAVEYLRKVYGNYQNLQNHQMVSDPQSQPELYFSKELAELILRDARCTPKGDAPYIDGMLFLDAQDFGEHGIGPVSIQHKKSGNYVVRFASFPELQKEASGPRSVNLRLIQERGNWRVADVANLLGNLRKFQNETPCSATQEAP
jgi:hypothetical protein